MMRTKGQKASPGFIGVVVLLCLIFLAGVAVTLGLVIPEQLNMTSPLTTHVLDTSTGRPADNLTIKLYYSNSGGWKLINEGKTNKDGRLEGLINQNVFAKGTYKLYFDTSAYFKEKKLTGFYPYVDIVFEITEPSEHYHVPLLLSPYGYSTYRGS